MDANKLSSMRMAVLPKGVKEQLTVGSTFQHKGEIFRITAMEPHIQVVKLQHRMGRKQLRKYLRDQKKLSKPMIKRRSTEHGVIPTQTTEVEVDISGETDSTGEIYPGTDGETEEEKC